MTFAACSGTVFIPAKCGLFAFSAEAIQPQQVEEVWPLGPQSETTLAGDLHGDRGAFDSGRWTMKDETREYKVNEVERFWERVEKSDSEACWLWTGTVHHGGYGQVHMSGGMRQAHRVAYELTYGPIPRGEGHHGVCVCHRCDTPLCCNPSHMFLGTMADNVRDRDRKGRQASGERNHSKLTAAQVAHIRLSTLSSRKIAPLYGVASGTIRAIRSGRKWRHRVTSPKPSGSR